jgi:hypothetical protein
MNFTAKRLLVAGVIAVAAIATPVSLSVVLPGVGSTPASSASPAKPDKVIYNQGTTSGSNSLEYVPGNGSAPTTQAITTSGPCDAISIDGVPLLNLTGALYSSDTYVGGTITAETVGANSGRTGVCAIPPDWAINNTGTSGDGGGAEALDFAVGANSLVYGRDFSGAQLTLQAESGSPITVELVESINGTQVATQTCTISASGATITADTEAQSGGACSTNPGTAGPQFDTLEVRDLTLNTSVSVVGPKSTFTMSHQICGNQQIQSQGPVSATLSDTAPTGTDCKNYTTFNSTVGTGGQSLSFNAFASGNIPLTIKVPWAPETECQPGTPTEADPLPECPPTQISYDGVTFTDQTFCASASPGTLCTTKKTYNYVVVDGVTETQITEHWAGDVDCCYWKR